MALNLNLEGVRSTEFGVGRDVEEGESFSLIPVGADVQDALREMAAETWAAMSENGDPDEYQPAEKHASQEYVIIEIDSEWATRLRNLHQANNLQLDTDALEEPGDVFCYFARFSGSLL
jgi:hypothetical protein